MPFTIVVQRGAVAASGFALICWLGLTTTTSCGGGSSSSAAAAGGAASSGAPVLLCVDAGGPTVGDLPCDVGQVLKDKCQPCHQTPQLNHAHFPLLTYEDTQQPFGIMPGERRWQRMAQVIEPGTFPHMPFGTAPQLTSSELDTLRSWFKACAPPVPEGQGCDVGEP
jgi:hypothetical protein